jgi:predicted lipoprotein with Yx(FWY)xxD motif
VHTSRYAAVAILAAGLIAGCGSSSKTTSSQSTTSAQAAAATVQSSSTAAGAGGAVPAALVTTKQDKLGTVLAYGPKHMTVYLFEGDSGSHSTCTGACAAAWPPVIGKPRAGGSAVAADLSTTKRSDGRLQVTYKGHPIYLFIKDKDAGDAYGQGVKAFGADWYALTPAGSKIEDSHSSSPAASSSSSSGSGYSNGGY